MADNYFAELYAINVNDHTEKKGNLTYLSWAWAWAEVKKLHPDATYTIYEWTNSIGCPQNYFTDGKTAWVKTGVTINGIEHIEELPVMDMRNNSIPVEKITSFDVNKAIQRSLTKAVARHGLGLYIYAGEDLPDGEEPPKPVCGCCGKEIVPFVGRFGNMVSVEEQVRVSIGKYGKPMCGACVRAAMAQQEAANVYNQS